MEENKQNKSEEPLEDIFEFIIGEVFGHDCNFLRERRRQIDIVECTIIRDKPVEIFNDKESQEEIEEGEWRELDT